jgi:hypothetical protein
MQDSKSRDALGECVVGFSFQVPEPVHFGSTACQMKNGDIVEEANRLGLIPDEDSLHHASRVWIPSCDQKHLEATVLLLAIVFDHAV